KEPGGSARPRESPARTDLARLPALALTLALGTRIRLMSPAMATRARAGPGTHGRSPCAESATKTGPDGRGRFAARRPVVGLAGVRGCPWFVCFFLCALGSGAGT